MRVAAILAPAVRLVGEEGTPRIEAARDGRVELDGLVPGAYRIELCGDLECARVTKSWAEVQVVRDRRTEVIAR